MMIYDYYILLLGLYLMIDDIYLSCDCIEDDVGIVIWDRTNIGIVKFGRKRAWTFLAKR